jgi:autotransporter translocation and assembly factor TamB
MQLMEFKKNKSMKKRLLNRILKSLLVFFIIFLLIMLFFSLPPGENLIKNQIQNKLSSYLGQSVEIGSLETDLFSQIQINRLRIVSENNSLAAPLLEINRLKARYTLWPLLKKEIEIKALSVSGMQTNLVRQANGIYNLPDIFRTSQNKKSPDTHSKGFKFVIKKVNLEKSVFHYSDKKVKLDINLLGLFLNARQKKHLFYDFQLGIDSVGLVLDENKLLSNGFMTRGQLSPTHAQLDTIHFNLPDGQLHGHLSWNKTDSSSTLNGQFQLRAGTTKYSSLIRNSIPAKFYPVESDLLADVKIRGELNRPEIQTVLNFSDGMLGSEIPFKASMQVNYFSPMMNVKSFDLKIFKGNISGNGEIQLAGMYNHHFTGKLSNLSLGDIRHLLSQNQSLFTGDVSGEIKTEGPLRNPVNLTANSNTFITRMVYNFRPIADMETHVRFSDKTFAVNINQGKSWLNGSFKLANQNINGTYSGNIRQIKAFADLAGINDLKGRLQFSGSITGQTNNPDIRMSFRGDSILYRNLPVDTMNGSLDYHDNILVLHKTTFSGKLSSLDSLESTFHLHGLVGGLQYHGSLEGPVKNPRGQLNIAIQDFSYKKLQLTKAEISMTLDGGKVNLRPSYLEQTSLGILLEGNYEIKEASGTLGIALVSGNIPKNFTVPIGSVAGNAANYQSGVIVSNFNLADSSNWQINVRSYHLDLEKILSIYPLGISIAGETGFDLHFRGRPSNPQGKLLFEVRPFQYRETRLDSIRGALLLTHSDLQLDSLVGYINGEQSRIEGRIGVQHSATGPVYFSRSSQIAVQSQGKNLSLELLQPLLPAKGRINGSINYVVKIYGRLGKPKIKGAAEIIKGSFSFNPGDPGFENIALNITFQDSLFKIKPLQASYHKTPFQLDGEFITLNWHQFQTNFQLQVSGKEAMRFAGEISPDSLNIKLNANNFDLSIAQPFISQVTKLEGGMSADLSIHGSFSDPLLSGQVNISQLGFQPSGFKEMVSKGTIKISLDRHTVRLDSFTFKLAGGAARVFGELTLDHFKLSEVNLSTSLINLPIDRPDLFTALIDTARFTYQKKDGDYYLNGNLSLGKSEFTRDIEPQEIIRSLRAAQGPISEPTELQKKTRLNIRLRQSKDLWIDNNLAKIKFNAALQFIGTLANPNVTGRVQAENGYVMYLDRKFQVDTAIVYFVNPNKLNPNVNLKATSQVTVYERQQSTDYTIILTITGYLDQPVVALTSNPPLNKSDILSVLTLGTTTGNLLSSTQSGSGVTNVLTRRVESFSSQRITSYLSTQFGNLLGLDEVAIEGNIFRFNQGGGPQLVAKKTFLKNFEVTYSTIVGHLNDQGVRLNYQFTRHWSIQGESNQQGETGLDLKYQINFK